jgi:Ca2+-binding EF-hand superfamily protein
LSGKESWTTEERFKLNKMSDQGRPRTKEGESKKLVVHSHGQKRTQGECCPLFDETDDLFFYQTVTEAEIAKAMSTPEGNAELRELFDDLDLDSNDRVTIKEWTQSVTSHAAIVDKFFGGSSMADVKEAFDKIDTNRDGHLTWTEFEDFAHAIDKRKDDDSREGEHRQKKKPEQRKSALFESLQLPVSASVWVPFWCFLRRIPSSHVQRLVWAMLPASKIFSYLNLNAS